MKSRRKTAPHGDTRSRTGDAVPVTRAYLCDHLIVPHPRAS